MLNRRGFLGRLLAWLSVGHVVAAAPAEAKPQFRIEDVAGMMRHMIQQRRLRNAVLISWQFNGQYATNEYLVPKDEVWGLCGMMLGGHMRDIAAAGWTAEGHPLNGWMAARWRPAQHEIYPHLLAQEIRRIQASAWDGWSEVTVRFVPSVKSIDGWQEYDPILHGDPYAQQPLGVINACS